MSQTRIDEQSVGNETYGFDAIRNTVGDQEPGFNQHGTGHWLEGRDHEHLFGNGANLLGAFKGA